MKCSIDDCSREALKRNLCETHYCKLRRSGELKTKKIAAKGAPETFIRAHADYAEEDCLAWPYFRDGEGYGRATLNGRAMPASRAMCIVAHGEPPSVDHEAAHICGNTGCVNPTHLYWATSQENNLDRHAHGTMPIGERSGSSRLTETQVLSIHAARRPGAVLAKEYGVTEATVYAILRGRTWSWLTGGAADWCAPGYESRTNRHANGWKADHSR